MCIGSKSNISMGCGGGGTCILLLVTVKNDKLTGYGGSLPENGWEMKYKMMQSQKAFTGF